MMKFNSRKILVILLLLLAPTAGSMAAELTGLQIMQHAYEVYAGKDIFSRLSFTLKDRNDTEKKLGLLMAYKSYEGENGFHSKIIMMSWPRTWARIPWTSLRKSPGKSLRRGLNRNTTR